MKIKNFSALKGTNHGVKSQHREWEKISVNHISGKGFISRIYKELQLNNKNCYSKMSKGLELLFLQRRYTNSQKTHENMSTLLIMMEMQIKATMRYRTSHPLG